MPLRILPVVSGLRLRSELGVCSTVSVRGRPLRILATALLRRVRVRVRVRVS